MKKSLLVLFIVLFASNSFSQKKSTKASVNNTKKIENSIYFGMKSLFLPTIAFGGYIGVETKFNSYFALTNSIAFGTLVGINFNSDEEIDLFKSKPDVEYDLGVRFYLNTPYAFIDLGAALVFAHLISVSDVLENNKVENDFGGGLFANVGFNIPLPKNVFIQGSLGVKGIKGQGHLGAGWLNSSLGLMIKLP